MRIITGAALLLAAWPASAQLALSGQDSKAVQVYRTAQGTDGTSTIAKLWIARLSRR